jgi:tRNA pseudouridine55 synthase
MARRKPATVHGLAVLDKPAGITSHDLVQQVRRRLGERRVGHAGTLDPDATGLMLIGVGNVTRLLRFLSALGKTYTAEVVFGVETSTLDAAGDVIGRHDMSRITIDDVREMVTRELVGDIMQIPPMVSALKIDGRRLHELAREGIEVERQPRPVTIHRFVVGDRIVDADDGTRVVEIEVNCSSGTYVRTLADDLGHLLGGGAHLRRLRRTTVGMFGLDDVTTLDDCHLLSAREAMRGVTAVQVDEDTAQLVGHGRVLPAWDGAGPWGVVGPDGELLAVYEQYRTGEAKPAVVLAG